MAEKPWANGHDLSRPDRSALVGQGDPGNADHRKQHAPTFNCPGVPRRWTAQAEGQDNLQGIVPPDRLEKVEQPVARSPGGGTAGRAPGKAKARPGTRPDSPTQGRRTTGGTSVLSKKRVLHTQGSARQHLGGEVRDCRCEYALRSACSPCTRSAALSSHQKPTVGGQTDGPTRGNDRRVTDGGGKRA